MLQLKTNLSALGVQRRGGQRRGGHSAWKGCWVKGNSQEGTWWARSRNQSPLFCSGRHFVHSLGTAEGILSPIKRANSLWVFWASGAPVVSQELVPGRVPACSAGLTCMSLSSPGFSKRHCNHGPAPLQCDCPSCAASCLDHRHRVCTKEADEKENLLYFPTENQYVRTNKPRVLWQSKI